MMNFRPFQDGDTFATFSNIVKNVVAEIENHDNDYVLKASPTELEHFFKKLIMHIDWYYVENKEGTKVDVIHHFDRVTEEFCYKKLS